MKTNQLSGSALDWAVAKCEGKTHGYLIVHDEFYWDDDGLQWEIEYSPSSNWAQGGPIIEREGIALLPTWTAERPGFSADGPTPLVAAMRCYVASKLGDEVEIPEQLLDGVSA